jgi:hypothetical protein
MVWGIIILAFLAAPVGMARVVNIHLFMLLICVVVGFFGGIDAGCALFGYWIMACMVFYFLVFFYLWVRYC